MKNLVLVLTLAVGAGLLCQACTSHLHFFRKQDVAAEIGSKKITVAEIDESIRAELTRIDSERYQARKAKLDQMVDDAVLADKAKSLGIAKDELVKREITDKAKLPTDEDVKAMFDKVKAQAGNATFADLAPRIKDMLANRAIDARRTEYLGELKKEAKVTILMSPPRFQIDTSPGHAEGPPNAPITLVEFSDYQCPFCGRSQDAVNKVLEKYNGKVHHVFMDFPLTAIHPFAKQAAVASHCAEEQGKYDEYHKLLFAHQRELSADNFKKWASELKMDEARFGTCLSSDAYDARIQKSLDTGGKAGITGTPGFFVNGIPIKGAQPFEVFQTTIDEELARAK